MWSIALAGHDVDGVKRIRRDSHVRIALCGLNGKVRGEAFDGEANIIAHTSIVEALEARQVLPDLSRDRSLLRMALVTYGHAEDGSGGASP